MNNKLHRKILVMAPHPDDEVLGCGGAIFKHRAIGDEVIVCIVSVRNVPLFTEDANRKQYEEVRKAHSIMGISETIILDFASVMLDQVPHYKLNAAIEEVVARIEPDIVYMPFVGDVHLDHQIVAQSSMVACRPFGGMNIEKILMYETPSETEWNIPKAENTFIPNIYVDICDFIEKKIDSMNAYYSQTKFYPHPRSSEKIRALASYRGGIVSIKYAEAFMLVREIS